MTHAAKRVELPVRYQRGNTGMVIVSYGGDNLAIDPKQQIGDTITLEVLVTLVELALRMSRHLAFGVNVATIARTVEQAAGNMNIGAFARCLSGLGYDVNVEQPKWYYPGWLVTYDHKLHGRVTI